MTQSDARLLPLEESLVRASSIPPTAEPAELLRAVTTEQETPAEELLRPIGDP